MSTLAGLRKMEYFLYFNTMVMENQNPFLKRFTGMLYANEQALHDSPYIVCTGYKNGKTLIILMDDRELFTYDLPSVLGIAGWRLFQVTGFDRNLYDIAPYTTITSVFDDDEATFRYKEISITYKPDGELSLQEFGNKVACWLKNAYTEAMLDQL